MGLNNVRISISRVWGEMVVFFDWSCCWRRKMMMMVVVVERMMRIVVETIVVETIVVETIVVAIGIEKRMELYSGQKRMIRL